MARIAAVDAEREAARTVASLMVAAARTAPKGRGVDAVQTLLVEGEDVEKLAKAMEDAASGRPDIVESAFRRDARNVRASACVVLIGITGAPKKPEKPFDCGACGYRTCAALMGARAKRTAASDYAGPVCTFVAMDLGVALSSAAKVAADHNIDNRIMYTLGVGACRLKWMESDVIIGIPLSVTGKSIYYDR